jgi:hypothetical protein
MNKYSLAAIVIIFAARLGTPLYGAAISGTLDGDVTLTPTGTPGVYSQSFTGDGDDTTYGAFTPSSTSMADFSKPPGILISDGMLTETFAHGTLFGTSSGDGTASGTGTASLTIDFVISGGTGVFAGASGDVDVTGKLTMTSPTTESFVGTYGGALNGVPDQSSTLVMLVPSVAAVFLGRARKTMSRAAS